jgi:ERCC4-type nuclease
MNYKYTTKEKKQLLQDMVILVDSREKKNRHILEAFDTAGIRYEIHKLDCGDYSFMLEANEELGISRNMYFDSEIIIERKANLEELSTNLTKERARFEKELATAPKEKMLLIEDASYTELLMGHYDTQFSSAAYTATLHAFWFRYHCPFIFVNSLDTGEFILNHFVRYLLERLR